MSDLLCGRQGLGGRLAVVSYVCLGLPAALLLGFRTDLATAGLAIGHTGGKLAMTMAVLASVVRTDWGSESDAAVRRVKKVSDDACDADEAKPAGGAEMHTEMAPGARAAVAPVAVPGEVPPVPDTTTATEMRGGAGAAEGSPS